MPTDLPAGSTRYPGGCLHPVLLRGCVDHIDGATGELLHRYTTVHEPGGVLPIACKTRRASRCPGRHSRQGVRRRQRPPARRPRLWLPGPSRLSGRRRLPETVPEQARDDRFRSRLGQRDRTARRARLRPPGLPYPGSRRPAPAPASAAQSVGPVQQPPGWSRQRDIERIADQQHQEAAPAPGTTNAPRRTRSTSRGPRARPRWPPRSMPPRLRR